MNYKTAFKRNSLLKFTLSFLSLFSALYLFNLFFIAVTGPGGVYLSWLDQNLNYIAGLRSLLLGTCAAILKLFGYSVHTSQYSLHVAGYSGIKLVYSCLGYGIMSFFIAFIFTWPKVINWKQKLVFAIAGLFLIQFLNVVRFILLSLFWNKRFLNGMIDHHDIYNIFIYAVILSLLYWWINYAGKPTADEKFN